MRQTIWDEMLRMHEAMDSLFSSFWDSSPALIAGPVSKNVDAPVRRPIADFKETEKEITATIELPGVDKGDIQVNAVDDGVEVKVEKRDEKKVEDKEKGYFHRERRYAGFYRRFGLPAYADASKIEAGYSNGVLELKIPKNKEIGQKAKRIEVK